MSIIPPCKPRHVPKDTAANDIRPASTQKPVANVNVHIDAACPICQEPVGQRTPEGKTEAWSKLPCGHKFGNHCIKHWLGLKSEDRPCCPICRQNASHRCGHPALPEPVSSYNRRNTVASPTEAERIAYTDCAFCRRRRIPGRKKTGYQPWRFVKGCWRLVTHGRRRERARPSQQGPPIFSPIFLRAHDPEWRMWQEWWSNQEPKNA